MDENTKIEIRCGSEGEDGETCNKIISGKGRFIKNPRGLDYNGLELENRFEMGCIKLECPRCNTEHYRCNMCYSDDSPPGWYRGESTGDIIPCDNCNRKEVNRQQGRY